MQDNVFGDLEYDDSWVKKIYIPFFGEDRAIELIVEGYEDEAVTDYQRDSFKLFSSKQAEFVAAAENAIFKHYVSVCAEYRDKFGADKADEWAPLISEVVGMKSLVSLRELYFPECMDDDSSSTFGFLLSVTWEPELGLAVKFVDGVVDEVGPQDIII